MTFIRSLDEGYLGKSFVYNTLVGWCHDNGFRVAVTASTGIAATVLIGGRTLHSTFWIPLEVTDKTESRVKAHKEYAEPIKQVELVFVDEISMLHRDVLKYLDTMFKDVCNNKDELFAGKVIVIGNSGNTIIFLNTMIQAVTGSSCALW